MRRLVCGGMLVCAGLAASVAGGREETESGPLPALNTTLRLVHDKYVDPARLRPGELFVGALIQLERDVAPVVVSNDDVSGVVVIQAEERTLSFELSKVHGLWDVAARLREVFAFLRSSLPTERLVLRDLEISAGKGLLEALDRQSCWIDTGASRSAGVGVAVSLRNGSLIVQRVVSGSVGSRAGLQRSDIITQIDDKLVRDMTLDEALDNLRGPVGSRVSLLVRRSGEKSEQGEKRLEMRRGGVTIASLESRQLRPGIGYIRIKHIDPSTSDELSRALESFGERGALAGLVLDLRDSQGGMFAESVKLADAFLKEGSVALVRGAAEGNEEKKARNDGTEPGCPLVLLTNAITASGSELIASALQKNERAMIVGETSFGSGKVQLVFPNVANAAVKLTIAEFQAPAGTTVQGVGVVPDIELKAARIEPLQSRFFAPFERVRAHERHQLFPDSKPQNQPAASIWYAASGADSLETIDIGEQSPRRAEADFALRLATDLVAQLPEGGRSKQIASVRTFLQRLREQEMAALGAQLQALGIDWRSRPSSTTDGPESSDFAVRVTTDRAHDTAAAGEIMTLVVSVTNRSRMPAYQVRAITQSQNADYHEKELLFGYVGPAQTVTRSVSFGQCDGASFPTEGLRGAVRAACRLSMSHADREDIVKIAFRAQQGEAPAPTELHPITLARSQAASGPPLQSPVSIEIGNLSLTRRTERIPIKAIVRGRDGIQDVRVFANERKVLYRRASPSAEVLPFEADVLLAPGINVLRVIARNRNDVASARTFIVRRDGSHGQPLQPRTNATTPASR